MKLISKQIGLISLLLVCSLPLVLAADIYGDEVGVEIGGAAPITPADKSECLAGWDCSSAEWEACKGDIQKMKNVPPDSVFKYCIWNGVDDQEKLFCQSYLSPSTIRGCFQAESFPFFTGWNILFAIMLLIGYYVWNGRKKK
jgi:hypothetical protein